MDKTIREFSVSVYGSLEKYNDTISKARCRIFYKGLNRNGTYITDDFADKLIGTVSYTPVKGIYDNFNEDFTDHGAKRDLGHIYGIVPENPNFAWEDHEDEDGVVRTYACVDVLLFTALYEEAGDIISKSQSMELYDKTIAGNWEIREGKRVFVFTDGCFLGLQVLGEEVEPCFEGAAFFSLYQSAKEILEKLESYMLNFQEKSQGGHSEMDKLNFKLSDSQKFDALFALLNPNFNEEGDWIINKVICDVYDQYAIAFDYENGGYERVYYTKDDTTDSLSINEIEKCYIVDVTEEEKIALEALQTLRGNYTKVDEDYAKIADLEADKITYAQKIEELEGEKSTLEVEKTNISSEYEAAQTTIADLQEEIESLKTYKLDVENTQKQAVIDKYSKKLGEEILAKYTENLGQYSLIDLDKELAYELVNSDASLFEDIDPRMVPKDEQLGGLEAILAKYRK